MIEKSFNLKVIELKDQLTNLIIDSKLPISVANLVVQDFAVTMQKSTDMAINNEQMSYNDAVNAEKLKELEES